MRSAVLSASAVVPWATTTHENGFVGFWLPKDITGTLEIGSARGRAVEEFATFPDSPTCLTTVRLV